MSIKDYNKNKSKYKSKYKGRPKLPKYKDKNGRVKLSMTNQSCKIKNGKLTLPKTKLTLEVGIDVSNSKLKEVRIIPMGSVYKIELVLDKEFKNNVKLNEKAFIGIDLGLSNLATITNNIGLKPIIINGKPLKSINQYYNNADVNGSYNILRKFDNTLFKKEDIKSLLTIPKIINLSGYINKKKLA